MPEVARQHFSDKIVSLLIQPKNTEVLICYKREFLVNAASSPTVNLGIAIMSN